MICKSLIFLHFLLQCSSFKSGFQSIVRMTTKHATTLAPPQKVVSKGESKPTLGVLLLNLGGPETKKDVEGFLYNLFADPDIIRLPPFLSMLQKPIAYIIAKRRAPKSTAAYESIGGGSPIVNYTQAQADLIAHALKTRGIDAKCYFAMRYWNPYTEEVLDQMYDDGIKSIVIVPLYPQYSISTSGSSLKLLQEIFYQQSNRWGPDKVQHTVVPSWYHRKGYTQAMAELIITELRKYNTEEIKEGLHVLFSAHGVPESYIIAGDPYKRQIEECVRLISKEVVRILQTPTYATLELSSLLSSTSDTEKYLKFHLSFQSRVGPVQWLKPYTEEVLHELGEEGVKNLIAVPVSFVSEHIETLEEMDMEYRELALESGIVHWERVPAVNTDDRFIQDMAELVVEALESPVLSLAEATQNVDMMDDPSSSSTDDALANAVNANLKYNRGSSTTSNSNIIEGSSSISSGNSINNGDNMIMNTESYSSTSSSSSSSNGGSGDSMKNNGPELDNFKVLLRTDRLNTAENINGRFAMLGIIGTTLYELLVGHPVIQNLH